MRRLLFFDNLFQFNPRRLPAVREARNCMSDTQYLIRHQRDARFRQRSIGRSLRVVYAGLVAEPPPEGFLLLLAEADQAHTRP